MCKFSPFKESSFLRKLWLQTSGDKQYTAYILLSKPLILGGSSHQSSVIY